MPAEVGWVKAMITRIQNPIACVSRVAEQLPKINRWRVLVGYPGSGILCHHKRQSLHNPPPKDA